MTDVVAHFTNAGSPLVAPATLPRVDIWRLDTMTQVTSAATMTEVGGGSYKYVFASTPTLEYTARADGDPGGGGQLPTIDRFAFGTFSGIVEARIKTDIPQILTEISSLPTAIDSVLSAAHGAGAWDGITAVDSIASAVNSVLSGAHGAGSWLTATGFAVPGDNMGLAPTAIDSLAVAVNSVLSGAHGAGNWEGVASGINSIAFAVWAADPTVHGAGTAGDALSRINTATGATLPTQIGSLDTRVASLATCCQSVFTGVTSITAAIAALNDLSQADVQAAMTAQGYTVARAALLDNLDVAVSAVTSLIGEQPTAVSSAIFGNIIDSTGATALSFFDTQQIVLGMAAGTMVRSQNVYGVFLQDGVTMRFQLRDDDPTGRSRLLPNSYAV